MKLHMKLHVTTCEVTRDDTGATREVTCRAGKKLRAKKSAAAGIFLLPQTLKSSFRPNYADLTDIMAICSTYFAVSKALFSFCR